MSVEPLAELELLLQRHFGYTRFRPLQARVLTALQQGVDVLAVLPTGGGKSICFQLPALLSPQPTLVISPLISLMQDQVGAARARGLPAAALHSALSPGVQREILDHTSAGRIRLLYSSPERLSRLAADLAAREVRPALLVLDEAHCISEWGPDFRPAYRTLRRLRAALGWPRAMALTGSATAEVRQDIARVLGLGSPRGLATVLGSFDRRNLWFGVRRVRDDVERCRALLEILGLSDALAIVYAPTRSLVEELARVLLEAGHRAAPYHAGLAAGTRREVLERFLGDDLRVVVATCAFGMGIDKPDVRLVVHWTLPATPEAYYQEAGRAGRDGAFARCILLYREGDGLLPRRQLDVTFPAERLAERVWSGMTPPKQVSASVRASLERLRRELHPERGRPDWSAVRRRRRSAESRIGVLERYASTSGCRRAALLAYFGERLVRCSGCDSCTRAPVPAADSRVQRRLTRLRLALAPRRAPWRGCLLEPGVLRYLAEHPPATEAGLAAVEGVGPVIARRYSGLILRALER